jgi:ribosomal-protein-alanine N-acetyltransferase
MTIRRLTAADLPAAAEIEKSCFSVPWTEGMLAGEVAEGLCLGAFEDEKLVGYCSMRSVLDEGYINNVAVLPAYRRRGIARALLTELEKSAEGLAFLTLEVRESNSAAQALYVSLGYLPVGRRPRYYERPVEDALLMTKYFTGR